MSNDDVRPSFLRRLYNGLFRVYGPAQLTARDAPESALAPSAVEQTAQLAQWEKTTEGGRTYLVRKPADPS